MPKTSPNPKLSEELQSIVDILQEKTYGIKISQIAAALPKPISQRTLLRRLSDLKQSGDIISKGQKNSTLYFIKPSALTLEKKLLLSTKAAILKTKMQQPLQQRKPVAYHPEFLRRYQPNDTFYLSEAIRKHLKTVGQPFNHALEPGTYVKRILHQLLIDLSWNSSRLEGNTYSLLETERLIEFGANATGKNTLEAQMIINHKEAIEFIIDQLNQPGVELGFNPYIILNIHALLSNNLLANPKARGQLRQIPVGIGKTTYHPPEVPQLIAECFERILTTAEKITDPFEQAFFAMVQLPYLQPFEDVNKRVSRLSVNIPFIKHNLSPLSFIDVPQDDYISGLLAIYELNKIDLLRDVFVWAYERSAQQYQLVYNTLGEPNRLHMQFKEELVELVRLIVIENIRGKNIVYTIQEWAKTKIDKIHREEFIRLVEREIVSLHVGNIAVYRITPAVFGRWRVR